MDFPYVELGFDHILDPDGYDHILFVLVMVCIYTMRDWRKILILVTAFTIGHSLTLLVASMKWITYDPTIIEILIPVTILISAIANLFHKEKDGHVSWIHYALALVFGLVHGLGFSSFFRALVVDNSELVYSLLGFNIGVELGQLLIVGAYLVLAYLLGILGICHKYIRNTISILVAAESMRILISLL